MCSYKQVRCHLGRISITKLKTFRQCFFLLFFLLFSVLLQGHVNIIKASVKLRPLFYMWDYESGYIGGQNLKGQLPEDLRLHEWFILNMTKNNFGNKTIENSNLTNADNFVAFNRNIAWKWQMNADFKQETLKLAAKNIAQKVGNPPSKSILIVCSKNKLDIARMIFDELEKRSIESHLILLGTKINSGVEHLQPLIKNLAGDWGLILLIQPEHASFLFETVGRPDTGLKISSEYLFCDWLIRPSSLIRTYGIDMDELDQFRQALLSKLSGARKIRVKTENGTDITIIPRSWNVTDGEVFTAPIEDDTNGTIFIDGCAYGGPPEHPFTLTIKNGEVVNLSDLSETDKQQSWVRKDLSRDENSKILAELGIGINTGARWNSDVMESEQTRGTCHFGFGMNIEFGGQNKSSNHIDYVILKPTIEVDGEIICRAGEYKF